MHVFKDSMWWVEEEIFWDCMGSKQGPRGGYAETSGPAVVLGSLTNPATALLIGDV
jgi:hypothetical protein